MHKIFPITLAVLLLVAGCSSISTEQRSYSVPNLITGPGRASQTEGTLTLENEAISCSWAYSGHLAPVTIKNKLSGQTLDLTGTELFEIVMDADSILKASDMLLTEKPTVTAIQPGGNSVKLSTGFGGQKISAIFMSKDNNLRIQWDAELRDQSNYIIQSLKVEPLKKDAYLSRILSLKIKNSGAKVCGEVSGSPVVFETEGLFCAIEHPLADNTAENGIVCCALQRNSPLAAGQTQTVSWVLGVYPENQLRRSFQYYVQRERAYPYRCFLHYNSWYDIAYNDRIMNEKQCLDRIQKFGDRFIKPYHVDFKSFVFDDGWDNHESLWNFNDGFPQGFTPVARLANDYHVGIGVWLSPWGGYKEAKEKRLAYGKEQGFEINKTGFSLSGPKYYDRFRQVCLDMIQDYGVNNFKFDGIAAGSRASSAGDYIADIESLLKLSSDLRTAKPDVFINITTGTWPSPYWLWYGDSIWRQGRDWWQAGEGSARQQWLTYRDTEVYERIVSRGPLYPLNSLMLHGIIFAQIGWGAKMPQEVDADLEDEIWSFFGSGTALQELYMTPELMSEHGWSVLAQAANWSHQNADVLVDTHWVGGNPSKLDVYGWASWSPEKGILTLRNPSAKPQTFALTLTSVFEIKGVPAVEYALTDVKKNKKAGRINSGKEHVFELHPFEVLVLEARPAE